MAQVSRVGPTSPRGSSEGSRARAWREMFAASLGALAGTVVLVAAVRAAHSPLLFVAGLVPFAIGAGVFFHGLWRYTRP